MTVRVSCGGLCRIQHPETGNYLLGLNANQLLKGQRVLTPLGGALRYLTPPPIPFQAERVDTKELRLTTEPEHLPAFQAWFEAREGRETTPFRELREELVDEYGVLPSLSRKDVRLHYATLSVTQRFSDRVGATGRLTHSFQEIFEVRVINDHHWSRLARCNEDQGLYWVSAQRIRAGRTAEGLIVQADALQIE